jgi:hypothetical protein
VNRRRLDHTLSLGESYFVRARELRKTFLADASTHQPGGVKQGSLSKHSVASIVGALCVAEFVRQSVASRLLRVATILLLRIKSDFRLVFRRYRSSMFFAARSSRSMFG